MATVTETVTARADPFSGPGEMRTLVRRFDWSATPLGPIAQWPLSLRTIVATLLASRHPMFLWWGPDLIQIYNDAYRVSFGAAGTRHPRALGARGPQFWTDIWDVIYPDIAQVMAGGGATWHEDHLVPIERNGRIEDVYWTYSYSPAFDDHGAVGGVLVVCQETTARVLTEAGLQERTAALEAARGEAEEANRAKGEFLAVMSHELRTPLNAIGGYAELMEIGVHGPITDAQRADLSRIQQSQKHLLGLINQVLNYTRVETGTVRYAIVDVPAGEALTAAEALVMPQVRTRLLTYVLCRCDPTLRVRADPDKLQQILLNLLGNAIKFTDAGGEIRVACSASDTMVAFEVVDSGIGIAPDKLPSIFDPFVQVDQRLKRPHEGVGLGLAISRDLARGMGGDLAVTSTADVGSAFTLTLPRVK